MTPLEELQGAHKRLSELRESSDAPGQWVRVAGEYTRWHDVQDGDGLFVAEVDRKPAADLIVTLHRTIDAQLAVLDTEIRWNRAHHLLLGANNSAQGLALTLARAINGEAS
ncbi:hypothetical protein [Curtobacterium sp. MCBA15_004]|uniref:hypothetical protein n=1 Tax=Curtobacterium sp. MCBA15_004 TaxID=1898733 RepID=UPI0008DC65B6|nr:hypothetical protein [Curtobacterium sp. MCBA15_004]WIA95773.1 hypothetical protein QOL16_11705 [Curtobacterium sp. MCBA15_004]